MAVPPEVESQGRAAAHDDRAPQPRLPRARRPRDPRRRVRRPRPRAARARGAVPRADHARLADPAGRRRRPDGAVRAGARTGCRCSASTTPSTSTSCGRGAPASSGASATRRSPSPASRRSTASPSASPTPTGGSRRRRRGATGASARTSPPTSPPSTPCPTACAVKSAPGARRGARRGVHAARRLRAAQRAPGRGRRPHVREPAQRGRRVGAPEGPGGHGRPGARRCGPTSSAPPRATPRFRSHHETLEWLREAGLPVNPEIRVRRLPRRRVRAAARSCCGNRHSLDYEIDGVVVKVDDLAPAGRARVHVAGAAVGDRLQVPARGAHDEAPGDPGRHRPHRAGDAVRRARAGVRRRRDRRAAPRCTTRTRCGPRTCAPATSSIVRRAGDVIPEVVGPVLAERPKGLRSRGVPDRRARCAASRSCALEAEADTFCVNVACPARTAGAIIHFASRGAMDIEGLGEQRVQEFASLGLAAPTSATSTPSTGTRIARARGLRRGVGPEPAQRDRRVAVAPARPAARRPEHPPPRPDRRAGARPGLRPPRRASSPRRSRSWPPPTASGRRSPRPCGRGSTTSPTCAVVEKLRAAGVDFGRVEVADGAADARRDVDRRHRHARELQPRGGRGGDHLAGRQVARQRVEEDDGRRRRRGPRRRQGHQGRGARRPRADRAASSSRCSKPAQLPNVR